MSRETGTCPVCQMTGWLTKDGFVRKHQDKRGSKRRYERETCAGSGRVPRTIG
jgi:uncharacterized protein (UPF0297 family)